MTRKIFSGNEKAKFSPAALNVVFLSVCTLPIFLLSYINHKLQNSNSQIQINCAQSMQNMQ